MVSRGSQSTARVGFFSVVELKVTEIREEGHEEGCAEMWNLNKANCFSKKLLEMTL